MAPIEATSSSHDADQPLAVLNINRTATDFDSRSYGYAKLSELVAAIGLFEVERRGQLVFVRDTRRKHASNAA